MSLRLTSVGTIAKPPPRPLEAGGKAEPKEHRPVYFAESDGYVECPIYDRYALPAGATFTGPAIVEEFDSTTVLHPGYVAGRRRDRQPADRERSRVTGFGVALAKDVMVPMRDGIRLATDLYRPARDGELVEGRYPTILCRTPYDKTDKRYSEIADFFVPHGYSVCLQDCRDRYRSEGTREYFHAATPHEGEDGYDTVEWIADQRWSNGRVGTVGSSFAGITQVRMALERPPHLTAIWPDVVPTNSFQHQSREGGAMQLHMFWALFIHTQDAQDIADDPEKQAEVSADLTRLRELFWETPYRAGQTSLRHVPTLEKCLVDYYTRGSYDELVAQSTTTRATGTGTPTSRARTRPAGTTASPLRHGVLRGDGGEERVAAAPGRRAVEPRRHARRRDLHARRRFGPDSAWGVQRYFPSSSRSSTAG